MSLLEKVCQKISIEYFSQNKNADSLYNVIQKAYTSAHRYYHTIEHIENLLSLIEKHQLIIHHKIVLELTALFHDYIYVPKRNDNELKSAENMKLILSSYAVPDHIIEKVYQYILATQKHEWQADDSDLQLFLDMDLSIMGSENKQYQWYAQQIGLEYRFIPRWLYKIGRKKVLQKFLQREKIFGILVDYEEKARKNLIGEIASLSS